MGKRLKEVLGEWEGRGKGNSEVLRRRKLGKKRGRECEENELRE